MWIKITLPMDNVEKYVESLEIGVFDVNNSVENQGSFLKLCCFTLKINLPIKYIGKLGFNRVSVLEKGLPSKIEALYHYKG